MPSALPVPQTVDDLTASWVNAALAEAGFEDVEARAVTSTPVAAGQGFIGTLVRLVPEYSTGGERAPASMVAKLPTTDPAGVALAMLLRLWEREARFYAEVAPGLPVRLPRCFYSGADPERGAFALLLEDLSDLTLGDQVAGLTTSQTEQAVDWLARFHAAWWGQDPQDELAWIPKIATDPMYQGLQPMLEGVWPGFVDDYGTYASDRPLGWVERLIPDFYDAIVVQDLPNTVIHADYRADNLFFDGEGDVAVIDWQATAVGQGLYDLAYLLGGSVPTDVRRESERRLVVHYGRVLREEGAEGVPADDELFDLYRKTVLTAMGVMAMLAGQLDLDADPRGAQMARHTVERLFRAGEDLEVDEFLDG